MSSFLDINNLYKYQEQREEVKREYYEQIMKKIHNRIENFAIRNETLCMYQIPEFVFGIPLYNRMNCCRYIIDRLKNEGFKVYYVEPYQLVINWAKDNSEPIHLNQNTKKRMNDDNFIKNILNTNQSNNIVNKEGGIKKPTYQPNGKLFETNI